MMALVSFKCAWCKSESFTERGWLNRQKRRGQRSFCSRKCSGLARRINKTDAQKKEEKRLYDIEYRMKNREMLKQKKHEYFKRTYDPVEAAKYRKARMHKHVEYCRRPEYKEYKRKYDRIYRAKKDYGEFWECHVLALDIRDEATKRSSDYDMRLERGAVAKCQKRKRENAKTYSKKLEAGPLGDVKRGQRR